MRVCVRIAFEFLNQLTTNLGMNIMPLYAIAPSHAFNLIDNNDMEDTSTFEVVEIHQAPY